MGVVLRVVVCGGVLVVSCVVFLLCCSGRVLCCSCCVCVTCFSYTSREGVASVSFIMNRLGYESNRYSRIPVYVCIYIHIYL